MNVRTTWVLTALVGMGLSTLAVAADEKVKTKPAAEKPVAVAKEGVADKGKAKMGVPDDSIRPQKKK